MSVAPGARFGAYEIVGLIGSGGMGEVYRARDPRLARDVAIKVLPSAFSADPERLRRFEQEARAAAALTHPNILAVHDLGSHDGAPYIVAELLEGQGLDARMAAGPLPVRRAIEYAIQIARGLAAAHDKGIVHRDLKPANVFITADGRAKILDFGLAKLTEREAAVSALSVLPTAPPDTLPGVVLGTLGYMSPEQVRGLATDHRSDIFAFGTILYEMLAGRRAFAGATAADTMTAILKEDPAELPAAERHLPPALSRIVDRCLEKNASARFQSAGDLAFALEALSSHSGTSHAAVDEPDASRARSRGAARTVAIGTAIAILAALALDVWTRSRPAPPTKAETYRFIIPPPDGGTITAGYLRLAVSPDGRRIAFVARAADGKSQLWIRRFDTLLPQPLNGTDSAINPFWSPDSRFVGFFASGQLKKIDITGGPPVTLCDIRGLQGGAWSKEGVIVVGGNPHLMRVSASGGIPVRASTLGENETAHSGPWFLPDGRHFIYSAAVSGMGETQWANFVGTIDSDERTRIADAAWPKALFSQGYVLFPRNATIMAQPFDSTRFVTTGEAIPIAEQIQTLTTLGVGMFSVSDTGTLAYQTGEDANTAQLVWMDRTGKVVERLPDRAPYLDVRLSPDGRRAAVSSGETARPPDVWIVDVTRGLRTRFTFNPSSDMAPIWSPDGSRIVFASRRQGHFDLFVKASAGASEEELLFADATDKVPSGWSPDGRFVVYTGGSSPSDIFLLPMSGEKKPIPFVQTPFNDTAGQISPDGTWMVYQSNESGRPEVYVASFPSGTRKWQVSSTGGGGQGARWRRDGKELFYVSLAGQMMAATVDGQGSTFDVRDVRPLFNATPIAGRYLFDVSADGQRILFNTTMSVEAASPITVVVNWLETLRK